MDRTKTIVALTALAAGLATVFALQLLMGRSTGEVSRRLVSEFVRQEIYGIQVERPGQTKMVVARGSEGFVALAPIGAVVDSEVVRRFLDALGQISYVRTNPMERKRFNRTDVSRARFSFWFDRRAKLTLEIGAHLAGIDRDWIARDDRQYLVQGHEVRNLLALSQSLRQNRPFDVDVGKVQQLVFRGNGAQIDLIVQSAPTIRSRGRHIGGDRAQVVSVWEKLRSLEILPFVDGSKPPTPGLVEVQVVTAHKTLWLRELGACPGIPRRRLVTSWLGAGCVAESGLEAIADVLSQPEMLYRKRLFDPGQVAKVHVSMNKRSRTLRNQEGKWRLDDFTGQVVDVDEQYAEEWLSRVSALPVGVWGDAFETPVGFIDVTRQSGKMLRISLGGNGPSWAWRSNESAGQRLTKDARIVLFEESWKFRSRQLWVFDLWSLIAVRAEVSGKEVVSLLRGRTHRDWKVLSDASRVVNRQAMDTLRLHASQLRAKRIVARRAQHRHGFAKSRKIELTFMEGNEQAEKRVIEIGAASPQGCFARTTDREIVFELDRQTCQALVGPWTAIRRAQK